MFGIRSGLKLALVLSLIGGTVSAEVTGQAAATALQAASLGTASSANDFQLLRAALVPVVEQTLNRVCGADCPAFSVLPNYKTTATPESTDDLGFSSNETNVTSANKEVASIAIEILASKKIEAPVQEAIRATVGAYARNYTDLPVSVRTKSVAPTLAPALPVGAPASISPLDWLNFAKTGIWPIALLLLAILGIVALAYYLRNRNRSNAAEVKSDTEVSEETAVEPMAPSVSEAVRTEVSALLQDRAEDVAWLAEHFARTGDTASVQKLIRLFPGDQLSRRLFLSSLVPAAFAKAAQSKSSVTEGEGQLFAWLKSQLDGAHWKRLAEQAEPTAKIGNLPKNQLSALFERVATAEGKAVVLSKVPSEIWPDLMSALEGKDRVGVGASLFKLQQQGGAVNAQTQADVMDGLAQASRICLLEEMLNEYVYFLSDEEATALSNELASQSGTWKPRRSVEEMIAKLDHKSLVELVMQLEVDQIRSLVSHLPVDQMEKVLSALPSKLRDRVTPNLDRSAVQEDPEWIRTRARLFKLYQELFPRSIQ